MRRILIPVLGFLPSGGNRVLCRLADEWIRKGHAVDFLCESPVDEPAFSTTARVLRAEGGLPPRDKHGSYFKRGLAVLRRIWVLSRAISAHRDDYDVILANHGFTAVACVMGGGRSKAFYYIQAYEPELFVRRGPSYAVGGFIVRLTYWLLRKQIVNSAHYLGHSGIRRDARVIPPGLDTVMFSPKADPGGVIDESTPRIGIIGRVEPYKYKLLLESFVAIRRAGRPAKLVIAYDLIPPDALSGIDDCEMVAPRNDAELANFYRSCDVFLALSQFAEGAFYPPLEALACGTCLISQRFAYITDRNAWIVSTPQDVLGAYDALMASPRARRDKADRGIADVKQLGWTGVATRFSDYFLGVPTT
jgi:glycosyltransferase involved in cell wall biosynthesis